MFVQRLKQLIFHNQGLGVYQSASVFITKFSTMPEANTLDTKLFDGCDDTQIKLMQEECILVNEDDVNIGSASKKVCHRLDNIQQGMLHRAFSVFLFNTKNELLLQQRSSCKITFPDHWTNTCCSHPLNFTEELVEKDALGVRRAAQRKLKHELGIEPKQVPVDDMEYLTRIQYMSPNVPADGKWGEHEIDYILFFKGDVDLLPNENEVSDCRFVTKAQLTQIIEDSNTGKTLITPWFRLIVKNFLFPWWDNLHNLHKFKDHERIHRM